MSYPQVPAPECRGQATSIRAVTRDENWDGHGLEVGEEDIPAVNQTLAEQFGAERPYKMSNPESAEEQR